MRVLGGRHVICWGWGKEYMSLTSSLLRPFLLEQASKSVSKHIPPHLTSIWGQFYLQDEEAHFKRETSNYTYRIRDKGSIPNRVLESNVRLIDQAPIWVDAGEWL